MISAPLVNTTPLLPQGAVPAETQALARFDQDLIQALFRELSQHAITINALAGASGATPPVVRTVLNADTTYFVNGTTGDDANNNGLTAGAPFKTIGRAVQQLYTIDGRTFNITVQVANGTYNEQVILGAPFLTSGVVTLRGDPITPSNVVITSAAGSSSIDGTLILDNGSKLSITGIKVVNTGSVASGIVIRNSSVLNIIGPIDLGAAAFAQLYAFNLSGVNIFQDATQLASFTITHSAGAAVGLAAQSLSGITFVGRFVPIKLQLTGTPNFTICNALSVTKGAILYVGTSYTGAATGQRFIASGLSLIDTSASGPAFIPGNVNGATFNSSVYA